VTPETAKSRPDISQITDYLYLSAWPEGEHANEISELGIRLILSMHWGRPSRTLREPPLRLLWLPTIDSPLTPMPIASLQRGAEAALPVIRDGGGVLTHCRYGIHRSAAMACCVLIGMGFTSEQAMQLVKEKRPIADPNIWYIRRRIEKFEQHWKRVHP
jgi:hypothetical protein